jgi:hypothetical protein
MSPNPLYLWAFTFEPNKNRLTIYPMRGTNLIFRNKPELDHFIDRLIDQSRSWYQAPEQNPEEVSCVDLGLSSEQIRRSLRRGSLFGKRK